MKLAEITGYDAHGFAYRGNVWPEVQAKIDGLRAVGSVPADVFFPILRTEEYGIARKLAAVQAVLPAFSDTPAIEKVEKFAVNGPHCNISARATERNLCKAWVAGRRLAVAATDITALERADARATIAFYAGRDPLTKEEHAKRLEKFKRCKTIWPEYPETCYHQAWNSHTFTNCQGDTWQHWAAGSYHGDEEKRANLVRLFKAAGKS